MTEPTALETAQAMVSVNPNVSIAHALIALVEAVEALGQALLDLAPGDLAGVIDERDDLLADRTRVQEELDDWASAYPPEVFPPDSVAPDAIAAAAMRHAIDVFQRILNREHL